MLADLRKSVGLTQQKLATASGINIRQIQKIESGEVQIGNIIENRAFDTIYEPASEE